MRRVPAGQAGERALIPPVPLVAVAARRARPRRVAWVHGHDGDAREGGLVLDERTHLVEGPARVSGPLPGTNLCPIADAVQVFHGDPASGAFGQGDDGLRDAVVLVTAEPGFAARQLPQSFLGT